MLLRTVRSEIAEHIRSLQAKTPRFQPQLAIIQAGARPDSTVYVRMKAKAAEEVGIKFKHITLAEEAPLEEVVEIVQKLNSDPAINGILVQLPLGPHIGADGERTVTEAVSPEKDVDGWVYSGLFGYQAHLLNFNCTDSTHTTSDICLLALRNLYSHLALLLVLSSSWNTRVSQLLVAMPWYSDAVTLLEVQWLQCSGAAMPRLLNAIVVPRTCRSL